MRLLDRLSAMVALLCSLVMLLMLAGSALSFFYLNEHRTDRLMTALGAALDEGLSNQSPADLARWLPFALQSGGISELEIRRGETRLYSFVPAGLAEGGHPPTDYARRELALPHHPELQVRLTYPTALLSEVRSLAVTAPLSVAIALMVISLLAGLGWLRRQIRPQETLEYRARRIMHGERDSVPIDAGESPSLTSSAIDRLLGDLAQAREQRSRVDILIRAFAARDAQTGLSNRLFFDGQLALQLEENQEMGPHGVVMMLRPPDPEGLAAGQDKQQALELMHSLINLISTYVMRYPDALLARYFRRDLAVLLPHCSLKDAESLAAQLVAALAALPGVPGHNRDDVLHIGICVYRQDQTAVEVMESVEQAAREAALQGGNTWSVFDKRVPGQVRGNVKWRTLLEQALARGGPQLFTREVYRRDGRVDHHVVINRIPEGGQALGAAEFMPMLRRLGLMAQYDRQQLTRILPLLPRMPDRVLAITLSVDSLLQRDFRLWLRNTLMQCAKLHRRQIMFELVEADLCQHLVRLRPVLRLLDALGCRLSVLQAGLTVVSTAYITTVPVAIIKLHPGLAREIDRRAENQLFIQSLPEACIGSATRVFATGVRTKLEWQTLMDNAVAGGQGDFFAPIVPLDEMLKKYSRQDE
ncbi:RNase E specificity factor CsrD [Acerihabitans arboris]|uniref:RNase E specificity factor CsrD n=1 Tax=Acerihabitans arboris TaxID=2691583 RepID=A0A845SKH2_9GAMM|nr:RNase E specificity factor CsrD [Acerihabitans arboris]NDL63496.1 RNase E specificity factor CsrD [Acerihabitans arboris]